MSATGLHVHDYTLVGLELGETYHIDVEALDSEENIILETKIEYLHALPPSVPSAPQISINEDLLMIDWEMPADNGAEIEDFMVYIRQSDGVTFTEQLCEASDPTIIAKNHCEIPLELLAASPFDLSPGDGLFAKVVAINVKGHSPVSSIGNSIWSDAQSVRNDAEKGTQLYFAVLQGDSQLAFELIQDPKTYLHYSDRNGWSPMHMAAYYGQTETL
jgi:hypothetical protein